MSWSLMIVDPGTISSLPETAVAGSAMDAPLQLEVRLLSAADAPDAEREQQTRQLRRELLSTDVSDVTFAAGGPAPDGSRGVDVAAIDTLIVTLGHAGTLFNSVLNVLRQWTERHRGNTLELTLNGQSLTVTGLSADDQRAAVQEWLRASAAVRTD